ncbi:4-hydroxybenzoyl-CoA reductase [Frankia sp. CcI49]|uniref:xanthine dehydrogenase family protein molybdopterin-binding subunit n=1 Tax=unclassified Frankia TaxID=2632575 RepID=UPI0006CA5A4F|nr:MULTISPECIES: xanthine dehydrogenase family protein molybdopterin-binding subunit [unclassified Frankia]KPM56161.1 4-hydroxybenzoyl-CoA reductase [Frankia sp. R43]ONH51734.1 4-hydroxybenzoyl-CoA reductase [Frankia sp. CcI49]
MIDPRTKVAGGLPMLADLMDVGPGLLHARLLTAPVAHARLAVDTAAARLVPGAAAVFSGRELEAALGGRPLRFGPVLRDQPPLAVERVRYAGEPVAVALATDPDDADEALRHVTVTYDPLPLVTDPVAALDLPPSGAVLHPRDAEPSAAFPEIRLRRESGSNLVNHFVIRKGDAPGALARADHVFTDTFTTPAMHHGALENHIALAVPDAERLVVWSATQTPYKVRVQLAEMLGVALDRVAVRTLYLGGAFGAKCYAKIEPLAACLARAMDRPVRVSLDRSQSLTTVTRHATRSTIETGVRADGRITARHVTAWFDAGAYADISPRVIKNGAYGFGGPYDIDDIWVDVYAVYTNRPPAGAFRGYASPQAAFAYEGQTEQIARRLGLDPRQVRRVNLLRDGSRNVTGESMTDCHYDTLLDVAENAFGREPIRPQWPGPEVREARGRGLALTVKGTNTPSVSQAAVLLNRDGSLQVLTSTVEMGQGAHLALARLAAEALGIGERMVSVSLPDTDVTPYDQQTSSSRSTIAMGGAVRDACRNLRELLARLAADHCGVPVEQVQVGGGRVLAGTAAFGYGELVTVLRAGQLRCEGEYASTGGLDHETGQGIASSRWHQASGAAEVAVDLETGRIRVLRYHAAVWAGRVVNPVEARMQVEGAVILGLGSVLGEELGLDPAGGQAQRDLLDYRMPTLSDLPEITVDLLGGPDDEIYGLGETAVPPVAPAVAAAVADATGVVLTDLPLRPERVLAALRDPGPCQRQRQHQHHRDSSPGDRADYERIAR